MKNYTTTLKIASLVGLIILSSGCKKEEDPVATTPATPVVLFTAADIQKSWTSGCLSGSDPMTSADHYVQTLTLFGGGSNNFNAATTWYLGSCAGGNTKINYSLSGTYTVGAAITGGQAITFNSTSSTFWAFNVTVQGLVNTACGGTSPWNGGTQNSGDNGVAKNSYMMTCSNITMPNSGNSAIANVATYSNSVLTLGVSYPNIPGVFPGAAIPTSATVQLF